MRARWLAAAALGFAALTAAAREPSVVLISLDTFRADRLEAWGGPKGLAPNLNGLAAGGLRLTRCFTPAPLTLPAHATLLTGDFPSHTGLHDNGLGRLAEGIPTLAQRFASRGYKTYAVVASSVLASRYGLARGFSQYDDAVGPTGSRGAEQVTDRALSDVKAAGQAPFFLWVHYFDTHEPYDAPERFAGRGKGPYDPAVAYVDEQVGRLLRALPPKTIVALVADHGEALGEHGEPTHGILLFQSTIRVPLVISGPGTGEPRQIDTACSLADVDPTLSALAGLPASPCDGRDLLAPGKGSPLAARTFPLETWLPFDAYRWSPLAGVTDGRFKWIRGPSDRLFDLQEDPGETHDLAPSVPPEAAKLRAALPDLARARSPKGAADPSLRGLGYTPVPAGSSPGPNLPDPQAQVALLPLLDQARQNRALGAWDRALDLCREVTDRDPGDPSAWFEYGETLRRAGRLDEALTALSRALVLAPDMAEAWTAKGHVLVAQGKPDDAARQYRRALELQPEEVAALNPLAAYYLDRSDTEKAFPLLDRAVGEGIANERTYLLQGRVHLVQDKDDRAARDFLAALQISPSPQLTLKEEADIYLLLKRFSQAEQLYREGIRLYPSYPPNYLTLGTFCLQTDRPEEALGLFRRALDCQLDPATRKDVAEMVGQLEKAEGGR